MEDLTHHLTPQNLIEAARKAVADSLPASKKKYLAVYDKFILWKNSKNATSFSENVLMAYFDELATSYKPSSLWSMYSMLKSTLLTNNDIEIKKYSKLTAFLKKQSTGFKPKKSKILTANDVEKFLNEAPDEIHLATKVIN